MSSFARFLCMKVPGSLDARGTETLSLSGFCCFCSTCCSSGRTPQWRMDSICPWCPSWDLYSSCPSSPHHPLVPSLSPVHPWHIFACIPLPLGVLPFDIRPWSLGNPVLGVWTRAMGVLGPSFILVLSRREGVPFLPLLGECLYLMPQACLKDTFWWHPLKVLHPLPWCPSPGP